MDIAIIEDLQTDYETLRSIINAYFIEYQAEYEIHWFHTGEEFLADFKPEQYDLIFFDVMLGEGMTGMDTAKQIRKNGCITPLVFTTTEREYALEGYEVHATDYLIKPYEKERVREVMQQVMKTQKTKCYLTITVGRQACNICTDELLWAESSDHYTDLHMLNGKTFHASIQFKDLVDLLPSKLQFQCCHRGIVVNLEYVDVLQVTDFLLQNGQKVPVSRSKREEMLKSLYDYAIYKTREDMRL